MKNYLIKVFHLVRFFLFGKINEGKQNQGLKNLSTK